MSMVPYVSVVGSLIMPCCVLDWTLHMLLAISIMSQFLAFLEKEHWIVVKYILKYLGRTKDMLLIQGNEELRVDGYTDLYFQFDVDN